MVFAEVWREAFLAEVVAVELVAGSSRHLELFEVEAAEVVDESSL